MNVELGGYVDGLDVKYEENRGVKGDSEVWGLRNWKEGVVVIKRGRVVCR